MKAYGGMEVQLHAFFDLGTRWRWVVSFTPQPLYPQWKRNWYHLDRRLGGLQSRSGRGSEEKNSQPPPEIETYNPDRPARSLVTIPTELSQLLCLNKYMPQSRIHWLIKYLKKSQYTRPKFTQGSITNHRATYLGAHTT
jgi:hypothetical protein